MFEESKRRACLSSSEDVDDKVVLHESAKGAEVGTVQVWKLSGHNVEDIARSRWPQWSRTPSQQVWLTRQTPESFPEHSSEDKVNVQEFGQAEHINEAARCEEGNATVEVSEAYDAC